MNEQEKRFKNIEKALQIIENENYIHSEEDTLELNEKQARDKVEKSVSGLSKVI